MLGPRAVSAATLIFNISTLNFENSALRSNGNLLLTTAEDGELLNIDPTAATPVASVVASFGGASILGMYPIGPDQFAVAGGTPSVSGGLGGYSNSSIWTVDLGANSTSTAGQPVVAAQIPAAKLLDGVVALPAFPRVVLVSDALAGVVYRVDTDTGVHSVAANESTFAGSPGMNGLKIHERYVYFVNSATGDFGRWAIAEDGTQDGEVEIIAADSASDDFALAVDGTAYLTYQSTPYDVYQVLSDGTTQSVASGLGSGRPTSVNIASDGTMGYFTTADGQVFKWDVPS